MCHECVMDHGRVMEESWESHGKVMHGRVMKLSEGLIEPRFMNLYVCLSKLAPHDWSVLFNMSEETM